MKLVFGWTQSLAEKSFELGDLKHFPNIFQVHLWVSPDFCFAVTRGCRSLTPLHHMTSFCSRSVRVNDSLLLDLTEELSPDRMSVGHLSCVVTVESQLGVRLSVHVLQLAISDKLDTPDRWAGFSISQRSDAWQVKGQVPVLPATGSSAVRETICSNNNRIGSKDWGVISPWISKTSWTWNITNKPTVSDTRNMNVNRWMWLVDFWREECFPLKAASQCRALVGVDVCLCKHNSSMCFVCVVNVLCMCVWVGGVCLQTGLCVSVCIFCEFLCLCACRRERDARKGESEGCSWGDEQTNNYSNYSKLLAAWWGSSSKGRVKDWEMRKLKSCTHTISTTSTTSTISTISHQGIVHLCRLHIYSLSPSGVETRITPSTGLYGVLERPFLIYNTAGVIVPDFRSAGSRMRLDYQGKPTVIYRGFRLLITAFHGRVYF